MGGQQIYLESSIENRRLLVAKFVDRLPSMDNGKFLAMLKVNMLRQYQFATGEELRPFFGRTLSSSQNEASGIPSAEGETIGMGV
jgi:hypothetical protein